MHLHVRAHRRRWRAENTRRLPPATPRLRRMLSWDHLLLLLGAASITRRAQRSMTLEHVDVVSGLRRLTAARFRRCARHAANGLVRRSLIAFGGESLRADATLRSGRANGRTIKRRRTITRCKSGSGDSGGHGDQQGCDKAGFHDVTPENIESGRRRNRKDLARRRLRVSLVELYRISMLID